MPDRIGITFTGKKPPQELLELGDNAELRITGTITADTRITGTADRRATSPSARDVILQLDLSDRFHHRQIASNGDWVSQVDGVQTVFTSQLAQTNGADVRNDTATLQAYVDQVQTSHESAAVAAELPLFGLDFSYEIGQIVRSIEGRNISLNRNSPTAATKRYLQIMAIRHDVQKQTTVLIVEPV